MSAGAVPGQGSVITEHAALGWIRGEVADGQSVGYPYGEALLERYDAVKALADHLHALLGNCAAGLRMALDEADDPAKVAAARELLRQSEAALRAAQNDPAGHDGRVGASPTGHDHGPYIHAVAAALELAFNVQQVGQWTRRPRRAAIWLGAADDWDDYRYDHATLLWHERDGWTLRLGGLTHELAIPVLAAPHSVANCVSSALGPTWPGAVGGPPDTDTCTAEGLSRYARDAGAERA